jgi:hypothetical protein
VTTDEDFTGRTGELLAGLALFRDSSVPAPSPQLTALFAATATAAPSALPTPRSTPLYKRILSGVPSKIAAAALGALLAGSLGAGAGALSSTMTLTSSEDDAPAVETPAVDDDAVVGEVEHEEEDVADVDDEAAVDEVDDDGANDAAADADLAAVPVPTSVSEAAHNHEFDEACGNHGHYVSEFAHTGAEPACAVEARAPEGEEPPEHAVEAEAMQQVSFEADTTTQKESKGNPGSKTSGGNWQSQPDDTRSTTSATSNTGKGGR